MRVQLVVGVSDKLIVVCIRLVQLRERSVCWTAASSVCYEIMSPSIFAEQFIVSYAVASIVLLVSLHTLKCQFQMNLTSQDYKNRIEMFASLYRFTTRFVCRSLKRQLTKHRHTHVQKNTCHLSTIVSVPPRVSVEIYRIQLPD